MIINKGVIFLSHVI